MAYQLMASCGSRKPAMAKIIIESGSENISGSIESVAKWRKA